MAAGCWFNFITEKPFVEFFIHHTGSKIRRKKIYVGGELGFPNKSCSIQASAFLVKR
jgi:hypothetical protein